MRVSEFFRLALIALCAATLSAGAFAAKEGFKSLNANPGYGGVLRSALFFTGNPNLIYLASEFGGITKSIDAGVTWTPTNNGLKDLSIRGIAVKPTDITMMYAVSTGGAGFYKSTDSGATWVPLPTITNPGLNCRSVRSISVVQLTGANQGHIYASTSCPRFSGVYKSENEGATWAKVNVGLPDDVTVNSIAIFGTNGAATAGVRVNSSAGVYQSVDSGAGFAGTYTSFTGTGGTALTGPFGPQTFSTAAVSTGSTVWLAAVQGQGVFRATAGTSVWAQVLGSGGSPKAVNSGMSVISNVAYVTVDGEGTYKSSDFGGTWSLDTAMPKQMNFVFADPNTSTTRWAATTAGIYKSLDSGTTWAKNTGAGQPGGNLTNVQPDPTNSSILYAAGNTFYKSTDAGVTWVEANSGLPHDMASFGSLTVASGGSILYATTRNGGIYKSTDGAATWTQLPLLVTGINGPTSVRIRVTPDNTGKIYATVGMFGPGSVGGGGGSYYSPKDVSKFGLYRSADGGATWTTLLSSVAGSVNTMSVSPSNSNELLAATGSGIYKSSDGGVSWLVTGPALAYPGGYSSAGANVAGIGAGLVRHDPLNGLNVLATVFDVDVWNFATPVSGFYRSKDGGGTWEPMFNSEKAGAGSSIGVVNGKSYVYLITGGHYSGSEKFNSVHKFLGSDFFTKDPEDISDTPLSVGGTIDGHPATVSSLSFYQGQVIGAATRSMGYEKLYRTNIGPDFNNDGVADVLWRNTGAGGQNFIWRMRKADSGRTLVHQAESAFLPTVPTNWVIGGYGDFNGDGNTDILWRNTATGDTYIYLMDGTTVLAGSGYSRNVPTAWSPVGVEDFDGDGKADILWRNGTTGDTYFYLMNGLTVSGEGYGRNVPLAWSVASVADFDGDGKADILWRNGTTGDTYFYLMNGLTVSGEGYGRNVPTAWSVAGTSDLDGDGKIDILWRNGGTGDNYVYFMNGLSISSEGYLPTVADPNWVIKGIGNYTDDTAARGILWSNATTRSNFLWRMNGSGLNIDGACSTLGCDNSSNYLPSAPAGWAIIK